MKYLIISFIISLLTNLLLIKASKRIAKLITDHLHEGPQKFHKRPTPRLGGVGIFLGFISVCIFIALNKPDISHHFLLFLISSIPVFLAGLLEDITRSIPPRARLILISTSAMLAFFLLKADITRTDISILNNLLHIKIISFLFTMFAIAGLTNAINIIDGFNGLASGVSLMIFIAIGYVAFENKDVLVLNLAMAIVGGIIGFMLLNYPYGLIFLGDGGAYFLGFSIAVLSILLVERNPQVSPWFPVTIAIYPIYETLFSIYRRKFLKNTSPFRPDSMHLHTLLYKTITKKLIKKHDKVYRNPLAS
ncbi:MAG: glycosyltransferase family 4 protein, partial [Hydrogenobaculum sp.]